MKKMMIAAMLFVSFLTNSYAQVEKQIKGEALSADEKKKMEDTLEGWKFGGGGLLTLSQAAFVNWAPGGTNSIALLFKANFFGDYKKGKHLFQSRLNAEYGISFLQDIPNSKKFTPTKNADQWEIFAKYGYKVYKPLYIAGYANLKSQFSNTYTKGVVSGKRDSVISTIGSPLVFEGAIGLDYVPNSKFSLFFSPLAAKVTYVGNNQIALAEVYGNNFPNHYKGEFGAVLIASYKQSFWKDRITISSIFKAYKNYLRSNIDPNDKTISETKVNYRKNIDVDWQTTIGFNVNKYLSASIYTQLIWDNDVLTPVKNSSPVTSKQQVQFRDIIGINVGYNVNYYKAKGAKPKAL